MAIERLGEQWASRTIPRFSLFREGRAIYEQYVQDHMTAESKEFCELNESDFARARSDAELAKCDSLYDQSLRLCRKDAAYRDIAVNCYQLGLLYHLQGRSSEAVAMLTEALEIADSLPRLEDSDIQLMSGCCYHLGILAARHQENSEAKDFFARSMRLDESLADLQGYYASRRALEHFFGESGDEGEDSHGA